MSLWAEQRKVSDVQVKDPQRRMVGQWSVHSRADARKGTIWILLGTQMCHAEVVPEPLVVQLSCQASVGEEGPQEREQTAQMIGGKENKVPNNRCSKNGDAYRN